MSLKLFSYLAIYHEEVKSLKILLQLNLNHIKCNFSEKSQNLYHMYSALFPLKCRYPQIKETLFNRLSIFQIIGTYRPYKIDFKENTQVSFLIIRSNNFIKIAWNKIINKDYILKKKLVNHKFNLNNKHKLIKMNY